VNIFLNSVMSGVCDSGRIIGLNPVRSLLGLHTIVLGNRFVPFPIFLSRIVETVISEKIFEDLKEDLTGPMSAF
jgi:hypothetical protein